MVLLLTIFALVGSPSAFGQSPAAFIENLEGQGQVSVGRYPNEETARWDQQGVLTARQLEVAQSLPNWVYSLLEGMRTDGFDAWDLPETEIARQLQESKMVHNQIAPGIEELRRIHGAVPEELRVAFEADLDAVMRLERLIKDLERLLEYLETKPFVTWQAVETGYRLQEGDLLKAGDGTTAIIRYETGAVARVSSGSSVSIWRPAIRQGSLGELTTRLWQGVVDFYSPPGAAAERTFGVETNMVTVGIRGTEFRVHHALGQTEVEVFSGEVFVESKHPDEPIVTVTTGQKMTFGLGTLPSSPRSVQEGWTFERVSPFVSWSFPSHWLRIPDTFTAVIVDDLDTGDGLTVAVGWLDSYETNRMLADTSYPRTTTEWRGYPAYHFTDPPDMDPGMEAEAFILQELTASGERLGFVAAWTSSETRRWVEEVMQTITISLTGEEQPSPPVGTIPPAFVPEDSVRSDQTLRDIDLQLDAWIRKVQDEWAAHPRFVQEMYGFQERVRSAADGMTRFSNQELAEDLELMIRRAGEELLVHPSHMWIMWDMVEALASTETDQ